MFKLYCDKRNDVFSVPNENYIKDNALIFGFNGISKVSYKSELSGKEDILTKLAGLTKRIGKVIISGTVTDNYGVIKKSAVIADNGKLLGISDMNAVSPPSNYSCGGGHRVYQTSLGRIGIVIGNDFIDPEVIKAMALCDADFIVCLLTENQAQEHEFLVRSYAFLYGLPVLIVAKDGVLGADIYGEIFGGFKEDVSHILLPTKKSYRLVTNKKRGATKD